MMSQQAATALRGGVAVITGAGSGIGEGLARHAAELGMKVVMVDIAKDRIDGVAAQIREAGGEALAVPPDVSKPESLDRLAASITDHCSDVRLLLHIHYIITTGSRLEP